MKRRVWSLLAESITSTQFVQYKCVVISENSPSGAVRPSLLLVKTENLFYKSKDMLIFVPEIFGKKHLRKKTHKAFLSHGHS